ncbi:hypothetical protein [Burkholderia cepacia]|uniref:hypothetical protein n=1 Tax=Burkholderia cepacia TaxID=292 RepID=UPI001CF11D75|nr:hypothetical protein [Burkholderia cepacia]MCA7936226.1 hypothetical protein [Burkholderia cepacia]
MERHLDASSVASVPGNFIGSAAARWTVLAPGWVMFMVIALTGLLAFRSRWPQ